MGFFKNVRNEFGTKTGKALGNALWGKAAEDVRMGFRQEVDPQQVELAKEMLRLKREHNDEQERFHDKQLELERESSARQSLQEISEVELDGENADTIARNLTTLSSTIAALRKKSRRNEHEEMQLAAARAKFDAGLAWLTAIAPDHPIVAHFSKNITVSQPPAISDNVKDIVEELTRLASEIEGYIRKDSPDESQIAESKALFESKLAMLKTIDPQNPMVGLFQSKPREWERFMRIQTNGSCLLPILMFAGFVGMLFLLYAILSH